MKENLSLGNVPSPWPQPTSQSWQILVVALLVRSRGGTGSDWGDVMGSAVGEENGACSPGEPQDETVRHVRGQNCQQERGLE